MTVNHKKGEFVDRVVKDNHINSIENQNKLLKKTIKSHRSVSGIRQYMALYFYMRTTLPDSLTDGERIDRFLKDIKRVYSGVNGEPLKLKVLDEPTPESMGISHLMPKEKTTTSQASLTVDTDDEDDDLTYIDNIDDDPDWDMFD
ncbi:hypothetical protein JTE90_008972 [Oedothorax gibbosus]|uniref:Uncharacterized protein n=1 Tax=Oedothorax gibbosus TaxID=931172 RepID=A0AAV6UKX8_9ARAC|nr:hypothetical protein JTE90_008972 [Oedothorax gibbosus]